jgi:hypothetical protein
MWNNLDYLLENPDVILRFTANDEVRFSLK